MEFFAIFFDIVTTHNYEICYVKHVLAPVYVVFTLFGCWGGGSQGGQGTTCLCSFLTSATQKWKFPKLFFYILTIQNDQISYVKHVLAPVYVFFTLFGCWGGGLPRGLGHNLLMQFTSLGTSKMENSHLIFLPSKMIKYRLLRGPLSWG